MTVTTRRQLAMSRVYDMLIPQNRTCPVVDDRQLVGGWVLRRWVEVEEDRCSLEL